ncbi:FliA/WhiG family RNA polymerase sigma factor [Anaerobacillus sp. MEB173]|uniref:FliA/WhiG family RNA polymerase sigma factor n=1 Tax=Anaerobacillus sp. MEB173 TaxID=3383345 RepID=UPI003F931114
MARTSLKKKDEHYWDRWINTRDNDAADYLIRLYLPLVNYHVERISVGLPRNVNKDDIRSHGMIGLYDALEKFDVSRELKFDTYASFRIRGAIIDGLRQEDWMPRSLREKTKKIDAAIEKLEQVYGRNVTAKEVAVDVELSEDEVTQVIAESFFSTMLSMDETTVESNRDETYKAVIEDKSILTPDQHVEMKTTNDELIKVIDTLNEKEKLVVSLFYFEELTLTEIGNVLNLSTSRISQIHSKALFRLQQAFKRAK